MDDEIKWYVAAFVVAIFIGIGAVKVYNANAQGDEARAPLLQVLKNGA